MPKTTFYDVSEEACQLLRRELVNHPSWNIRFISDSLDIHNAVLAESSEVVSVLGNSRITAEIINKLPALRLLAIRSTGFDHIDLKAAARRSILVCSAPDYAFITVAEYTLGLLLVLMRRLAATLRRTRHGDFSRAGLTGYDLHGKTLGLIGTGRIGTRVAYLAHAFGMHVLACDPVPNLALCRDCGVVYLALDELLSKVDALSLHVPYTEATHHLLNEERLRMLKPGVVLVNTARGGIVDSRALARLQAEGHFGGLALDCFEGEEVWINAHAPLLPSLTSVQLEQALNSFQMQLGENVILTPHNAFNSKEALQRLLQTTLENIEAFFAGNPKNLVQLVPQTNPTSESSPLTPAGSG
jgi:D-lactate dehydrogenase